MRTVPGASEARRVQGVLVAADDAGFTLEGPTCPTTTARLTYDEVDRARTVFTWGPRPAPSPRPREGQGSERPRDAPCREERVTTP